MHKKGQSMKKIEYENATVYITIPNEKQLENIRNSTERFVKQLMAKGLIHNVNGRKNSRRAGVTNTDARQRNKKVKKKDSANKTIHRSL